MVASNDEHFYEPELLRLKGELALAMSAGPTPSATAAAEAAGHFERGIEIARGLKGKSWELGLMPSRARLLARNGEVATAAEGLASAHGWFTEGFETGDIRAARELLQVLQPARAGT